MNKDAKDLMKSNQMWLVYVQVLHNQRIDVTSNFYPSLLSTGEQYGSDADSHDKDQPSIKLKCVSVLDSHS